MQDMQTLVSFTGLNGCTYHFVGGSKKPYRVYDPGEDIFTSNNYKAVDLNEADNAFQEYRKWAKSQPTGQQPKETASTKKPNARAANDPDYAAILQAARVRPTDQIPPASLCLAIEHNGQQYRVGTLGNISTIAGKAKSKKTFAVSFAVAAAVGSDLVIDRINGQLPPDKQTVLVFDTEQSREDVHKLVRRICTLSGHDNPANLLTYSLRDIPPDHRLGAVSYAIHNTPDVGLVVIDGVRDLAVDPIMDSAQASQILTSLLQWSSRFHLHIMCVLHENKHDKTLRGFLGTELVNKSETVLSVTKSPDNSNVSTVAPEYCRGREFQPFSFSIDDDGTPSLVDSPAPAAPGRGARKRTADDLKPGEVEQLVRFAFDGVESVQYGQLRTNLMEAARSIGVDLAKTRAEQLIRRVETQGYVKKSKPPTGRYEVYHVNPEKVVT